MLKFKKNTHNNIWHQQNTTSTLAQKFYNVKVVTVSQSVPTNRLLTPTTTTQNIKVKNLKELMHI